jgi:hypothetical protein
MNTPVTTARTNTINRARLAIATVELCEAWRRILIDGREEADVAPDLRADYDEKGREFFMGWKRGDSIAENIHTIEVAIWGYARNFKVDEPTKAAAEKVFLAFIRPAIELARPLPLGNKI